MLAQIFGAYCSTSWAERNYKDDRGNRQTYFGTGETFLFVLANAEGDEEGSKRYEWVDKASNGEDMAGLSKAERHARELFMSASHEMISIGGG